MDEDDIGQAKSALRIVAHARRAAIPADRRTEAAQAAAGHFFDAVPFAPDDVVAAYWPIASELDCRPMLVRLMDSGQRVVLPVTNGDGPLVMRLWETGAPLYPSGFGTLAPIETAPELEPDIVIIPLLGFDGSGTRLGYGQGHYDRTLATISRKPRLIGYAFSEQEIDHIPRAPHDIPLDAIVTEAGVRFFPPVAA